MRARVARISFCTDAIAAHGSQALAFDASLNLAAALEAQPHSTAVRGNDLCLGH